jgi:hypothetical protein
MICERKQPVSETKQARIARFRSVPNRQPYIRSVLLSAVHYMCILATVTTLAVFVINPSHLAARMLIFCLGFTAITWLLAYFKRRSTHCPLCKGTPLLNSGALPHKNAIRIFPFNRGVSAILSVIATHKFRCMYCGNGFDILKQSSHQRGSYKQANGEN